MRADPHDKFDGCGYYNGEFIGCEVKLSTVSEGDMTYKLNAQETEKQLLDHISNWNDPNWECRVEGDPIVKRGLIISIYVDKDAGQFVLVSRWINVPQQQAGGK